MSKTTIHSSAKREKMVVEFANEFNRHLAKVTNHRLKTRDELLKAVHIARRRIDHDKGCQPGPRSICTACILDKAISNAADPRLALFEGEAR